MNKSLFPLFILLSVAMAGCGAASEKLDPQFEKAFNDQGKRPAGQPSSAGPSPSQSRGQALPPGATPPPSNP